jgi:hypothetical protein
MSTEQPSLVTEQVTQAQEYSTGLNRDKHLRKTRLCVFFQQGVCKHRSKCPFAHGKSELHQAPSLHKTRICPNLHTCSNENCTYAHSQEELQSDVSFKTNMCRWHMQGKCRNGGTCRFAHGMDELRGEQEKAAAKVAPEAGKAKKKSDAEVLQEASNIWDCAPRGAKNKPGTGGYKMVEAQKVQEENYYAHKVQEEYLAQVVEPMFIQLSANKEYASGWGLRNPVKVYSKLSKEKSFDCSWATGYLNPSLLLGNEVNLYNHINEVQKSDPTEQDQHQHIACLVGQLKSLSAEVNTLQQTIAQQSQSCRSDSQENSESTKSGSVDGYSEWD